MSTSDRGGRHDHRTTAFQLPARSPTETRINRYNEPGVVVCPTSSDHHALLVTATTLQIIVGRVSWEVLDRNAFITVAAVWNAVYARVNEIWPT